MKTSLTLLASAIAVSAHGTVPQLRVDGTIHQGFLLSYYYDIINGQPVPDVAGWYAENLDNGFVEPAAYKTPAINCHIAAKPAPISVPVAAGGEIEFLWSEWPASHVGPVLTYAAKCPGDCSSVDKETLKWTKIEEAGIDFSTQVWAATDLINNNNTWVTTVPSSLAPGNYVFRHEIIAMHGAGGENGAQNYPQCFNIEVTGSGTQELPEGTLGTDLYNINDPGILFNPYQELTEYDIPGPALWTGAAAAQRRHAREFA